MTTNMTSTAAEPPRHLDRQVSPSGPEKSQAAAPSAPRVRLQTLKRLASTITGSSLTRLAVGLAFGRTGVPFRGTRIRTEGRMSFAGPMLLLGNYERAEIDFIAKYLPNDLDVLEVGASIGATSCQIARKLDRNCRLTCVEANPYLIPVLQRNIAENAAGRSVEVVHALVGTEPGEAFFSPNMNSLASAAATSTGHGIRIRCESISTLVSRFCPGGFSLVCDIEGAEAAVLGDRAALERCRFMVIEAHATCLGGRHLGLDEVMSLPLRHGEWRIVDRYGAVAAYARA
jgi:FkbM family methyltransferase